MDYPDDPGELYVFDFSTGYDPEFICSKGWGIGRYNERRSNMYETSLFGNERNVHVGIDIWGPAGESVYSFFKGEVAYMQNNSRPGDYGPTLVVHYELNNSSLFALYGHLSLRSLEMVSVGQKVHKGQKIAELGGREVNGGWAPHLHFQLSNEDPDEADMPGVVEEKNRADALEKYPDPRIVLGKLY